VLYSQKMYLESGLDWASMNKGLRKVLRGAPVGYAVRRGAREPDSVVDSRTESHMVDMYLQYYTHY
jgi:hypothetical protein